jgi:tRNA U38,U39,U40 pseudouridine synthase TruA
MVRSIVGVQLAVDEGKISIATINTSLKTPLEERFKYVVPADGLYLWKIKY